jgi:O-antigen/teichoic acid export membrane protein
MSAGNATPTDLGSRILSGVAWKGASQIILQVSRMVVALIVARMVAPHDWGLAAMVLVVSGLTVAFTDSALGTALIQRPKLFDGDRSTVFWLSTFIGLALAVVGIALSGPLASFYGEPTVRPLFMAVSVGFLISALGTTHSALLVREMQFRRLELRQIAATLVGSVAAISIAFSGGGAWAIVGQQVVEASVSTVLLWCLMPWRPSLRFSSASLRRLGGFAGNVFGENIIMQSLRSFTSLLMGRLLGATSVGTYTLATSVILVPFTRIAAPLQQVFFPAFSRMSDDRERLADVWIRATRLVGLVSIPSLVGLVIVAPDFVQAVLGPRWSGTTIVIQILAWAGLIASLQTLTFEVLLSLGRAATLFHVALLAAVLNLGAFAVGVQWGVVGVAVATLVVMMVIEPLRLWLATRALGISPWRFFKPLVGIAQATAVMAVTILLARAGLVALGVPAGARLAILVLLGGTVYAACCLWRAPEITREIRETIIRRRSRRPQVEAAAASL